MNPGWLRSPRHLKLATALAAITLIGLIAGGPSLLRQVLPERQIIPDEKAAAAALLAERLSGPRYFQSSTHADGVSSDGALMISVASAQAQVDRVAQHRQFSAAHAAKLRQLIERLAEEPASRMVGEASVNLLRLNLALDELR